jgi:hypothetical protein
MTRIRHVRVGGAPARLGLVALALALAACTGAPAATAPPATPTPAPTPTRDPHLTDPTTADDLFRALRMLEIEIQGTNAQHGADPVARINATYAGWPVALAQYSSTAARAKFEPYRNGAAPSLDQPPYTFSGLNIAVRFGPIEKGAEPAPVSDDKIAAAKELAEALDRLIGPVNERSMSHVAPIPTPKPSPGASPVSPAPSP